MNVEELKKYQEELEKKYDEIDNLIISSKDDEEEIERLEYLQEKIDDQLDMLDDIIEGIYEVPRKYNELLELKKEYESLLGD